MGLTKEYLAYQPVDNFNIIASGRSNVNFVVYNKIAGRYVAAPAAENIIVWDLRLGERIMTLRHDKYEVTALRVSPDHMHIAVGYTDGMVNIFDLTHPEECVCSLSLHKSAISILRYDSEGIRLICGSLDTEIVVIDVLEQAGRRRLLGHNAPITDAHFIELFSLENVVVSSSKDTQIKFWNLETEFCFKTIVDNRTEVWGLAFSGHLMIAGCSESTMNVYRLKLRSTNDWLTNLDGAIQGLSLDDEDTISPFTVTNCGIIQRAAKGRCVSLVTDPTEQIISCHGTSDLIENFYICTENEAKERLRKRLKKVKKSKQIGAETTEDNNKDENNYLKDLSLTDEIKRLETIKVKEKIKSLDVLIEKSRNELRVLVSLSNNTLRLYSMMVNMNRTYTKLKQHTDSSAKLLCCLYRPGHQSEVRTVCFSSDSLGIGSGSGDSFKFWKRDSLQCLRSVATDYILCSTFVPGDRYVLLGLKNGKLLIVDVGVGDIIEEIPAHDKELWSIVILPDQQGCVTGGSDATVKIWKFELIDYIPQDINIAEVTNPVPALGQYSGNAKVLSLLHKSTLKLEESVLCLRLSPDMKYLAVGLLDSTVKIFYLDTFKFHLSLYGHKLPILCLDISYDLKLIATGSADRNVKIWGLRLGECNRTLFAHDDSVMAVQFIPKTRLFFTCGKDGKIKQWDGDTFNKIQTFTGHIGEAYTLAVSPNGLYMVSCGSDRTIRLYERTNEPLVLQDIQEEERAELDNQQLATGEDHCVPLLPGLKLASRKTVKSEKGAESILECLNICKQYDADIMKKSTLHPLMQALKVNNTPDFLLITLSLIRSSDLEESLLLLPFSNVCDLLERLPTLIEQRPDVIELLCKVTIFLFKVHMKAISGAKHMKPLIEKLLKCLCTSVTELRDIIGINLHSLALLQNDIEKRENVEPFLEATRERKKRLKRKRQHELLKRHFTQMS